jgi:hypothetical protein
MKDDFSRRNFLRVASGAVSLSWGGLRIFAGPPNPAGAAADSAPPSSQPFVYGTAFYRPPNPPASVRREMLKDIAQKYQFNIIRIYPAWSYYNPAPDRFVFDDVDEVMKYCDEFGLRVLLGIVMEEAPYWLERIHPETRYVDAKGNALRLVDSPNNVSGGWPGLCWDWEPVQQAAARFIHAIAKMAAAHPSMYAYELLERGSHRTGLAAQHVGPTAGAHLLLLRSNHSAVSHLAGEPLWQPRRSERCLGAALFRLDRSGPAARGGGNLFGLDRLAEFHHRAHHVANARPRCRHQRSGHATPAGEPLRVSASR